MRPGRRRGYLLIEALVFGVLLSFVVASALLAATTSVRASMEMQARRRGALSFASSFALAHTMTDTAQHDGERESIRTVSIGGTLASYETELSTQGRPPLDGLTLRWVRRDINRER